MFPRRSGDLSNQGRTSRAVAEAVAELGESLFDDALQLCDDEKEAAAFATATLVQTLEREQLFERLASTTGPSSRPPRSPAKAA